MTNARYFHHLPNAEQFLGMGELRLKASLHGPTKEIHDSITRSAGSFDQALTAFKNLNNCGIEIGVNFVVCQQNVAHLKCTMVLLDQAGGKDVYISGVILMGTELDNSLVVGFSTIREQINPALDYLRQKGIRYKVEKLPVCVAPLHEEHFLIEKDHRNFFHPAACDLCSSRSHCMGVQTTYVGKGIDVDVHPILKSTAIPQEDGLNLHKI